MRLDKEEPSMAEQVLDLISAVKELHGLSSQELNKLLRETENFTIHFHSEKGSTIKIDVEKLAGFLPLHLIAVLMSSDRDESLLRYLLCGIRLLHSLCDLAPRHSKLEQVLLDDVKVSEQLLDLVFYLLIVLSSYREENHDSCSLLLVHSALVASSLHLLTGCISSQWQELVQILLAHPKVDIFMDAAFGAVHVAIRFLQIKLSDQHPDLHVKSPTAEQIVNYLCQQCEASLHILQSLCQQKLFRERLLRNKIPGEAASPGELVYLVPDAGRPASAPQALSVHLCHCSHVGAWKRMQGHVLADLLSDDRLSFLSLSVAFVHQESLPCLSLYSATTCFL